MKTLITIFLITTSFLVSARAEEDQSEWPQVTVDGVTHWLIDTVTTKYGYCRLLENKTVTGTSAKAVRCIHHGPYATLKKDGTIDKIYPHGGNGDSCSFSVLMDVGCYY